MAFIQGRVREGDFISQLKAIWLSTNILIKIWPFEQNLDVNVHISY